MYPIFLFTHSWLRWIVLCFLMIVLLKFTFSLIQKKPYTKFDRILSSALLGSVHLQFVLGLILYFKLSPLTQMGLTNFQIAMKSPVLRYWTAEHLFSMTVFVVLIQIGFSFSKRAVESVKKHRYMLIFSGIAFVLLLASIPWPFHEYGRTLFRSAF